MGWPTPCQEHCRKRLQEALLSRFSSDRTQGITGGPPTATPVVGRQHQAEPAEARILFVFRIQKAPKGRQTEPAEARILFVLRIHEAPKERPSIADSIAVRQPEEMRTDKKKCTPGARRRFARAAHWTNGHFATVLGTGEIQPTNDRLQPQILTTVSGIETILEVQYEGGW